MAGPALADAPVELEVQNLSMEFGRGRSRLRVLDRVDFSMPAGQFLAIVGPNGCGKTTLVRLLAGLLRPIEGVILHCGSPVTGPSRSRLLMFQQPTLFPWMTVNRNIDFALRANDIPAALRSELIDEYLNLVGLVGFADSYPHQLSGGMQQRAELARALAVGPRLLLMDEPFAALDSLTRITLQEELAWLRTQKEITCVMITHDVPEAVFLADRILLMTRRPGSAKQIMPVSRGESPPHHWRNTAGFTKRCAEVLAGLREELDRRASQPSHQTRRMGRSHHPCDPGETHGGAGGR